MIWSELLRLLAQTLYLFAPLLLAAALSGLVMRRDWLHALYRPIDSGVKWRGQPLLGRTKTWRGIVVAVIGCIVGVACQRYLLAPHMQAVALLDYASVDVFGFGAALGLGATLGELPNSFVKRRLGIGSGQTSHGPHAVLFYVWDQLDLLTLVWPMIAAWVKPTLALVAMSIAVALVLHPLTSVLGFVIGARASAR
jgi:hypothetical protein